MPNLVNPFCRTPAPINYTKTDNPIVYRVSGGHVDKETLQYVPEFEAVDLVEEIQACKDLAGVEYMKKLLATGQALPEDFQDDGQGSFDGNLIPSDVHTAKKLAEKEAENIQKMAKEVGLKEGFSYTQQQFEDAVKEYVGKLFAEAQAKAQAKAQGQTQTKTEGESK